MGKKPTTKPAAHEPRPQPEIAPEIVETSAVITIEEICVACRVEQDWVRELVAQGVITPVGDRGAGGQQFTGVSLVRVARAKRLDRDLNINVPGIALALELLEEIENLRSRLQGLAPRRTDVQEGE